MPAGSFTADITAIREQARQPRQGPVADDITGLPGA